jgi:signal transduction histidine kinase
MADATDAWSTNRRAWRGIRPRLLGIMLVPTIAALAFGALHMESAISSSRAAARAESVAVTLPDSFRLAVQLTVERDAASAGASPATLAQVEATTDAAVAAWRRQLPGVDTTDNPALARDLATARAAMDGISNLRKQITRPNTQEQARADYTTALNVLLGIAGRLPELDDGGMYRQTYALAEIRTASEALGVERTLMGRALAEKRISRADQVALGQAQRSWDEASAKFYARTSPAARAGFDKITDGTSAEGSTGAPMQGAVAQVVKTGDVSGIDMTPADWQAASADFIMKMVGVIVQAASDLSDDVSASGAAAKRSLILNAVMVIVVLLLALIAASLAARSILRPLRRLRQAALDIHRELPDRVRRIELAEEPVDVTVEPIGVARGDEIGEVAEAFEAVHAEAVRLAGEQAHMRANVNRMFVNLSHRSQSLVERQLRLIDELEANEQDPDDLANLFRLDHLATRMRRNDESLLVLAGGDIGQANRGDVPVLDALRAAASEIEHFARVQIECRVDASFRGAVVADVVHLLAELIENATNFSPPDTPVLVRTTRATTSGPMVIEIADRGIGMTPDELAAANAKLRSAAGLDADVARMMGLVVTSRLAHRHGLTVKLHANSPSGVVATVLLPADVFIAADPAPLPSRAPSYAARPDVSAKALVTAGAPAPTTLSAAVREQFAPSSFGHLSGRVFELSLNRRQATVPAARPATGPVLGTLAPTALDLPAVRPEDETTPIYALLQSEWFRGRTSKGADTAIRSRTWESPGDAGWRRAAEVGTQAPAPAQTPDGLPVRVPGRNLIPGTAAAAPAAPPPAPRADPQRTRGLGSFQRGVGRARRGEALDD